MSCLKKDISIIIPTFNEKENVPLLVKQLETTLADELWEVIFVDDCSPDGTADVVRSLAREKSHIRCIERIGRRGLSSAVIEGMLSSSAPYLAVMDGDLQHDASILPKMIKTLRSGEIDLVVGSRYVPGGGIGQWDRQRAFFSRMSTKIAHLFFKSKLQDPMSGYFAIKYEAMRKAMLNGVSGIGFKILLDILASSPKELRVAEIPYTFNVRSHGESKLGFLVAWEYVIMLLHKKLGGILPQRFLGFAIVGGVGVVVHFVVLILMTKVLFASFTLGQTMATLVAMVSNFTLNNLLTYSDQQLSGWKWVWGLITFALGCGVGMAANIGIATALFAEGFNWSLSAIAGILSGLIWNYMITAIFTWRRGG